jgi:hypothetical protein
MKIIAYTRQDGGVSVIYPTPEFINSLGVSEEDGIKILGDKDVPSGLYYKILNTSDLPLRETRSAWELNLDASNSDGIGLTKEEFEAKYPEYKGMAVQ